MGQVRPAAASIATLVIKFTAGDLFGCYRKFARTARSRHLRLAPSTEVNGAGRRRAPRLSSGCGTAGRAPVGARAGPAFDMLALLSDVYTGSKY
jgi:hypothetical protein